MKRWIIGVAVLVLVGLLSPLAEASVVTVTANPLWTNTGIISTSSDTMTIYGAAGAWDWGKGGGTTGPDGDSNPAYAWDFWVTSGRQGQLIGFVGTDVPDVVQQDNSRLFVVGTGTIVLTGVQGTLWLGMNDDYSSHNTSDNSGSVTVHVDEGVVTPPPPTPPDNGVPEPTTIMIWSLLGTIAIGIGWSRRYALRRDA